MIRCPNTPMLMDLPKQQRKLDPTTPSDWRAPDLATLPDWGNAARVGFDTETNDATLKALGPGVRRKGCYMVGASFALEDKDGVAGPKHYLPWGHDNAIDNLPRENCIAYFKDQFARFEGEIVGANLPYDLDYFWEEGIEMPKVKTYRDVLVADPLIYELYPRYRLEDVCKRWGDPGKNEDLLRTVARECAIDPKEDLWRLAARYVGPYAEDDAAKPLRVLRAQEVRIDADELRQSWEMECKILPIIVRMTRRGIVVNLDRVAQMEVWCNAQEQKAWDAVARATGVVVPVGECMDVTLLSRALRAANLPVGTTPTGNDSITKDLLSAVPKEHPGYLVAQAVIMARKMDKIKSTYINGVRKHAINYGDEWRVHCSFNQIRKTEENNSDNDDETKGVAFGRLSASHPNLQNQPAADRLTGDNTIGCRWRSVFQADRGTMWSSFDLKQQEPKWSFHFGAILEEARLRNPDSEQFAGMTGALALCAALTADPTLDTYEPLVTITGKLRPVCKIMWLARAYGKGDGKMCAELGYPTEPWVYVPFKMKSVRVDSDEGRRAVQMRGHVVFEGPCAEGLKVIQDFDATMPFLKASSKLAQSQANKFGYVKLISNRRCHFEKSASGKGYEWTNAAFNRLIQGSAAEQTKGIMIAVDEGGFGEYLALQVHDELDAMLETDKQRQEMREIMIHAVPMRVPTIVDLETGPSWGESMYIVDGKTKRQYTWDL